MEYIKEIKPIAIFHSPFPSKFGVPKQSGLIEELEGMIIFNKEYGTEDAIRGIEEFDYLWLIWGFSANAYKSNSLVVRPPLLGGNTKMGVFATRSPFRPNGLGLSSVKIKQINRNKDNQLIITVLGADLMDKTPIYDIKPYIVYADAHPNAHSGFVDKVAIKKLKVIIPSNLVSLFSDISIRTLTKVLELDPRPHYHQDENKLYGFIFQGKEIKFYVKENCLYITQILIP